MPTSQVSKKCVPSVTLTSNLFFPHIGGVENSLFYLAKAYKEMGSNPIILTSDIPRAGEPRLPLDDNFYEIPIRRYAAGGIGILPGVLRSFIEAFRLYRRNRNENPNSFTVCRYHYNQLVASLAGVSPTIFLVPGVIKFQNAPKFQQNAGIKYRLRWYYHHLMQKWALQRANHVAVFSDNMAEQLRQIGFKGPIHMTKPGVDLDRFSPITQAEKRVLRYEQGLSSTEQSHVFLCVGRCVGVKGFHLVIEALRSLPLTAELWIVGDGTDKPKLEQLAEDLDLSPRITFFGAVHDTERLYQLADTFVHSSLYEPLGQTVLEALASGLAIVALEPNKATGVNTASRDLLNDEHCVFVAEPSASSLANGMQQCLARGAVEYDRQADRNRRYAEQRFSWQSLAKDLQEIVLKDI